MVSIIKEIYKTFLLFWPRTRTGDKFIAYLNFIRCHKRLPNKKYLNDKLFEIKTSDEILSVLRQYTSDKEFVKSYIAETVGDELNVPTKAILRNVSEINAFDFTEGDVVKPTHASGMVEFVKEHQIDKDKIAGWLTYSHYETSREANYRYLEPKIIVERCIFDRTDVDDIKFFCVNGEVRVIQWDFDRHENHTRMLYDRHWNSLESSLGYPKSTKQQRKPEKLNEMIVIAEKLAKPFNFVRVDLYYDEDSEAYFCGEITHCHGSANERFDSLLSEQKVGNLLFG